MQGKRRKFLAGASGAAAGAVAGSLALPNLAMAQQQPLKVGFSMGLTGALAPMGKAALLCIQIWAEEVNARGGLLGRKVELVYYDDQSNGSTVPAIYTKLLEIDKVDIVVSSYGTAMVAPPIPMLMQRGMTFMTLFGLDVSSRFNYDRYFAIMPAGPKPAIGWTQGYFDAVESMNPKPKTIALVGADAEYPHSALEAAHEHVKRLGLKIVYDKTYPPNTVDFSPVLRAIQSTNPDIVFVASYPPDSVGMIRAAHEVSLKTRLFGGGMVGTQYTAIKTQLGPALNGVVSLETYAPEANAKFPGLDKFLEKYQARAAQAGVDPLGFYLPPYAYAMMQVIDQTVTKNKSIDQAKMAETMHKDTFDTVVGKVQFGKNGEWTQGRLLYVQYNGITSNSVDEWRKPGRMTVLSPKDYSNGKLREPYQEASK
ncbi:MAG: branched-chain amino acid transporter substrate-binding protein [Betaproteobacteria bacterium]|nr:branched-chain amino acid transporter substrate-binding protein [Betaproteobacteria bacterium]